MKRTFFLSLAFTLPLVTSARANFITPDLMAEARCFVFDVESPQRDFHFEIKQEKACYLVLDDERQITFLLNEDGIDMHTSALINKSEEGIELTHFSQSKGETIRAKQLSYTMNPLPVPATLEEALDKRSGAQEAPELAIFQDSIREDLNKIIDQYYNKSIQTVEVHKDFSSIEKSGLLTESYYLPRDKQPADGYWWPHTGVPLADGPTSPLAKYDAYVKSVTGTNPNSYSWERANHYTDTFWAGHCNGWVASSILYGFDNKDLYDDKNNTTITASDLQGLRTATSYCVSNKVMGKRYRGATSDLNDISPEEFHKNLIYYIKLMKKPIAIDYLSMLPVDNHIVSGYSFDYRPLGGNRYMVTAKLKVHGYNYTKVNVAQIAKHYELTYRYYLTKDSRGNPVAGRWLNPKDHPDFMWVPLAQAKCKGENPKMHHKYVEQMIKSLKNMRPRY